MSQSVLPAVRRIGFSQSIKSFQETSFEWDVTCTRYCHRFLLRPKDGQVERINHENTYSLVIYRRKILQCPTKLIH